MTAEGDLDGGTVEEEVPEVSEAVDADTPPVTEVTEEMAVEEEAVEANDATDDDDDEQMKIKV